MVSGFFGRCSFFLYENFIGCFEKFWKFCVFCMCCIAWFVLQRVVCQVGKCEWVCHGFLRFVVVRLGVC